jgi:hypothetical protein
MRPILQTLHVFKKYAYSTKWETSDILSLFNHHCRSIAHSWYLRIPIRGFTMMHSSTTTVYLTPAPSFCRKRVRIAPSEQRPSLLFSSEPPKVAKGRLPSTPPRSSVDKKPRLMGGVEPISSEHWRSFHRRFKNRKEEKDKSCGGSGLSKLVFRIFLECTRCDWRPEDIFQDDDEDWVDESSSRPLEQMQNAKWHFWTSSFATDHDYNLTE